MDPFTKGGVSAENGSWVDANYGESQFVTDDREPVYALCHECSHLFKDNEPRFKNPHSDILEFCTEECARLNRCRFCEENPSVFVLYGGDEMAHCENVCTRGVYANEDQLKLGVAYWMETFPNAILSYQEWVVGYPQEPESWEWCYIPLGSNSEKLASGGGSVPKHLYWGRNLVGLKWESEDDDDDD